MKWPEAKIVEVLTMRLALASMRGQPQPVTRRVLERLGVL